jgi:hypothetical protein
VGHVLGDFFETKNLDQIQRLLNLQPQRQLCSRLEHFTYIVNESFFVFKTHLATRGIVIFYSASAVTHDRRIGCCHPGRKKCGPVTGLNLTFQSAAVAVIVDVVNQMLHSQFAICWKDCKKIPATFRDS